MLYLNHLICANANKIFYHNKTFLMFYYEIYSSKDTVWYLDKCNKL